MKRFQTVLAGILATLTLVAQTEFDALRYLQPDISGTARYSAMGGAFGALGADASAIKDNPAGLGIYRSSELSATMNVFSQRSTAFLFRSTMSSWLWGGLSIFLIPSSFGTTQTRTSRS